MIAGRSAPAPAYPSPRPEFTWDATRLRLTWANEAGVAFWGEDSLIDLTERVFAPGDETVRALAAREAEMAQGGAVGRVTLYPQGDPIWARVECTRERRDDGRTLMRVGLDDIEAVNDPALVRKRAGFDAAPRPMAIYDEAAGVLVRNEADRRACPDADGTLYERYEDETQGRRALAVALAEGAFSHTAVIRTATAPLRHRISLRRMRDPATGAVCVIADFTDLSDRPAPFPAPSLSSPLAPADGAAETGRGVPAAALARIAHDLRAPLGAISGFAEMLRVMGDAMPPERRTGALEDISTACERLTALTDRVIALGGGAAPAKLTMVDLGEASRQAARLFAAQAEVADVTLDIEAPAGVETLADRSAVLRILDNLLQNALTHGARRGGRVGVKAGGGAHGEPAWLEVSDDGAGLSPDRIAAVLDAHGGQPETGQAPALHGIGLANVVRLSRDMAADLTIKTREGEGFTARVTFAVDREGSAAH